MTWCLKLITGVNVATVLADRVPRARTGYIPTSNCRRLWAQNFASPREGNTRRTGGRVGFEPHGRVVTDARFRVECLKPDSATLLCIRQKTPSAKRRSSKADCNLRLLRLERHLFRRDHRAAGAGVRRKSANPINCRRVRPQRKGITSASQAALPSLSANNGTAKATSHTAAGA
jgi:hypothetical protein